MVYLSTTYQALVFIIPLCVVYGINIIGAIYIWFKKDFKDKNGNLLK